MFMGLDAGVNDMKGKSLLLITPFAAPQSHAAVFRAHKLAKYLSRDGWDVHLLSTNENYNFYEDPGLLEDLKDVKITRTMYVEPTARGMKYLIRRMNPFAGGAENPYKYSRPAAPSAAPGSSGLIRRVYEHVLENRLGDPDFFWTWKYTALPAARELIRKHDIRIVMTSSFPYSTLDMGLRLKKEFGIKWVADFRDLLTYSRQLVSKNGRILMHQKKLERLAIEEADASVMATSAGPLVYGDVYGNDKPVYFISTGLDEELLEETAAPAGEAGNYILYAGEYHKNLKPAFLDVFNAALENPEFSKTGLRLKIVGRIDVNRPTIEKHAKGRAVASRIDLIDHMPQKDLYAMIRGARAVVLGDSTYQWWNLYAKLVDYLALRKPVLACVPDPSEARKWLVQSRLGIFLDGNVSRQTEVFVKFILGAADAAVPDEAVCERFTVKHQVREFKLLFESLLDGKKYGSYKNEI